jgi:hypothetical protein
MPPYAHARLFERLIQQVLRNIVRGSRVEKKLPFKRILEQAGVDVILTPPQAPNCNAFAERFVLSIKSECLDRMIFFGERSLRRAVTEFVEHYHAERAHQGIGNVTIENVEVGAGEIECHERLGGILKHYTRAA